MPKDNRYVTFGQIQKVKEQHFANTGNRLSFPDAIRILVNKNNAFEGEPEIPDFLSWNQRMHMVHGHTNKRYPKHYPALIH